MGSVEPTGPVWSLPPLKPMVVALPCATAAVKLTGDPVRPGTVAVAPCAPTVVPKTRVAVAMPAALVTDEEVIEPPPVTAQVTVIPPTGLPAGSVTSTAYGTGRGAPIGGGWRCPALTAVVRGPPSGGRGGQLTGGPTGA